MRIAFIWPHACTVYHTLPLSFGLLYDSIRDEGHDVRLFNLPLEGWTADSPEFLASIEAFAPDLIGATAWPMAFPSALAATRNAKKRVPDATCILGGNYATLNSEQAFASGAFDYLITGEAERAFPAFVRLLAANDRAGIASLAGVCFRDEEGTLVRNKNVFHSDMDALGRVDYGFIQLDRAIQRGYMRTILGPRRKLAMFASRGCEYACNFCTAPIMNGPRLRHYSAEYLKSEIRAVYDRHGIRMIYFMDDNITQDVAFLKQLCRAIISLELRDLVIELYRGVRLEALDAELLSLMKRANFKVVTIAPESGSERVRKLMNKDMASDDIRRAARMVKEADLWLQAYFILGYPGESASDRRETYAMIDELDLDIFELHKFMALPGTATFLKLLRRGKLARDHVDEAHIMGDSLPDFNGDAAAVDREMFLVYLRFYLQKPWKAVQLLHLVSVGGLWRSLSGMTRAAAATVLKIPQWSARPEQAEVGVWRPA
ncbi:MAG: radical SAM protein [Deltaproteobacteria bacterium]